MEELLNAGINAVSGDKSVRNFCLSHRISRPNRILALGKAACSMYMGLPDALNNRVPALIVTKEGHVPSEFNPREGVTILESSHPLPTKASLYAGKAAMDFVAEMVAGSKLLMLVSGGASALVEHLNDGIDLSELLTLNQQCLGGGDDIATINNKRAKLSQIKQGGLLSLFNGGSVEVLAVSDVQGDAISVIGSGIGARGATAALYCSDIVASNEVARREIAATATSLGLDTVKNQESLYGDIEGVANSIYADIRHGPAGLYIYGGEPTVVLPDNPGQGGRNQALALLLARHIKNRFDLCCVVAGTDGTDGTTDAAGGYADGHTYIKQQADVAINKADSATFLAQTGHQIVTGPTGTNVMDIALVLKT